jgi:Lipocalin-like domain
MVKFKWLVILVLFLIAAPPSLADDRAKLLGTWRLVSFEAEFQKTGEREPVLGKNPTGYVIYTPEGRYMVILTGEGRKAAKTDQDRAELMKSMFAYTGLYRLEGDKIITKVDASWNPEFLGTEQVRYFRFDGDRLQLTHDWHPSVLHPERGMVRAIYIFERAK